MFSVLLRGVITQKVIVFAAFLAMANAGFLGAPVAAPAVYASPVHSVSYAAPHAYATHQVTSPAIVSQHANVLRTPGNLGQVSTYSKSIQTPFSSVSKHDVRVSNDAVAHVPVTYAHAPVTYSHTYAAPVAKVAQVSYAAPAAYATHSYAAPAAYATHSYAAPAAYATHSYAAPAAYAAPVAKIGVTYSAAPAVSHMTYANSYGVQYGW